MTALRRALRAGQPSSGVQRYRPFSQAQDPRSRYRPVPQPGVEPVAVALLAAAGAFFAFLALGVAAGWW